MSRAAWITYGDIKRCPKQSFLPQHYRADGTCRCDEREAAAAKVAAAETEVREAQERLRTAKGEQYGI